jgi:IS1 family transposase
MLPTIFSAFLYKKEQLTRNPDQNHKRYNQECIERMQDDVRQVMARGARPQTA